MPTRMPEYPSKAVKLRRVSGGRSGSGEPPIRVGVISPLTGSWTAYGKAHLLGAVLAVDEINAAGGVLGRKMEIVVADSMTHPRIARAQAYRLIEEEGVDFLVGTFSSAERNAVGQVVRATDKVLLYPTFYEGQDPAYYPGVCNENIFMLGLEPTQQVGPHIEYMLRTHGPRVFLIGSDYIWPRGTNLLARRLVQDLGGEIVGEVYVPLSTRDYADVLRAIRGARPHIILHSLAAYDSIEFRRQLHASGMRKHMVLWSLNDEEIVTTKIGPEASAGDYAAFDYFMSIAHPNNEAFLERFRAKFGRHELMNTVGVAMYNATHMAAVALAQAGAVGTEALRESLRGLTFDRAPQGAVRIRPQDNQAVLPSFLVRVREDWTEASTMFEEIQSFPAVEPMLAPAGVNRLT